MANRAYLFCSDGVGSEAWCLHGARYYDSRWEIPLAWFFFYTVRDIRQVEIRFEGSVWNELKLAAPKDSATRVFLKRKELLLYIVGNRLAEDRIIKLHANICNWKGRFLLMDPGEIFSAMAEDEAWHTAKFKRILELLDEKHPQPENVAKQAECYLGSTSDDPELYAGSVLGYTYW